MTVKDFEVEKNGRKFLFATVKEGQRPVVRYAACGLANLWVKYELMGEEKKRLGSYFIRKTASRAKIVSVFGG